MYLQRCACKNGGKSCLGLDDDYVCSTFHLSQTCPRNNSLKLCHSVHTINISIYSSTGLFYFPYGIESIEMIVLYKAEQHFRESAPILQIELSAT